MSFLRVGESRFAEEDYKEEKDIDGHVNNAYIPEKGIVV